MNQYFERADEIRHLSEAQIEQIYERYLSGEKSADLIAEFQIHCTVRSLLKVLPPIISREIMCPYCTLPMWVRRHAKGTKAFITRTLSMRQLRSSISTSRPRAARVMSVQRVRDCASAASRRSR